MLTEKDYCDYDTCVALEELGYDDSTDLRYNSYGSLGDFLGGIKAPTLYEAQKWLREEKGINVYVKAFNREGWFYIIQNYKEERIYPPPVRIVALCHSYEEALSEGIKESVKNLKENYG
jgi:hypothetical protein